MDSCGGPSVDDSGRPAYDTCEIANNANNNVIHRLNTSVGAVRLRAKEQNI
jgi:hypothetical protein